MSFSLQFDDQVGGIALEQILPDEPGALRFPHFPARRVIERRVGVVDVVQEVPCENLMRLGRADAEQSLGRGKAVNSTRVEVLNQYLFKNRYRLRISDLANLQDVPEIS